jgi:hypothetical protein
LTYPTEPRSIVDLKNGQAAAMLAPGGFCGQDMKALPSAMLVSHVGSRTYSLSQLSGNSSLN